MLNKLRFYTTVNQTCGLGFSRMVSSLKTSPSEQRQLPENGLSFQDKKIGLHLTTCLSDSILKRLESIGDLFEAIKASFPIITFASTVVALLWD